MNLYIVVEITTREFDAKTFLACCAAVEGYDVVIGEEDMIRRLAVMEPAGIYYDKSLHTQYPALFQHLRKLGHRIVVNDDEGFIIDPKAYSAHSLTQAACDGVDIHLTWGQYQQRVVQEYLPELAAKSFPVGNVRIDLLSQDLRPFLQEKADALKEKWGRIVLVNTRASIVNNAEGEAYINELLESGEAGPADLLLEYIKWDTQIFESLKKMLPVVCKRFPDHTFILRPHPSEDMRLWEEIEEQIDNAHLVREGNVHEWILASEMVIVQHGCSTAAEAFFLETPCISYLPVKSDTMTHGLTNNIAYIVPDAETVCECLAGEHAEDMETMQPIWHKAAAEYVASLGGTLAAKSTITFLDQAAQIERQPKFFYQLQQRINAHLRNLNRHAKIWLRNAIGKPKKAKPYGKWQPLTLEEFKKHVARFHFYDSRFADLEITSAYLDCFRIRMPNNTKKNN
jgi:surface carbohydrate biosynthesis protein